MTRVEGGITASAGFLAAGVVCGIKRRGKDLALILSEQRAVVAGTVTQNRMRAPCVDWARKILKAGSARAIVANSGNANCCTGRRGRGDTAAIAQEVSVRLSLRREEVLVASTGVIGRYLPMDRVRRGIKKAAAALSRRGSHSAAEAILTTDTHPKELAIRFTIKGHPVTLGGIAKGSGMVAPHMATMFAFLTTDARMDLSTLRRGIRSAVEETFNAITVDGETSTNDMVLLLANGASEAPPIREGTPAHRRFMEALKALCRYLAHEIVRDGEGVTRCMSVLVTKAADREAARQVARRVAQSLLVKTMVAGRDPNWGRVAAAVGAAGVPIHPEKLQIRLGNRVVFKRGEPARISRRELLAQVDQPEVQIGIDLGVGSASAHLTSGDLTEEYVRINAKYTT